MPYSLKSMWNITTLTCLLGGSAAFANDSGFWSSLGLGGDLEVSAEKNVDLCGSSHPLLISISNHTSTDVTNVEVVAYVQEENRSRAECAEYYPLDDLLIKSGSSIQKCFATLKEVGIHHNGKRISDQAIDDAPLLNAVEYSDRYGSDLEQFRGTIANISSKVYGKITAVSPKQYLGCRKVAEDASWHAKIQRYEPFTDN